MLKKCTIAIWDSLLIMLIEVIKVCIKHREIIFNQVHCNLMSIDFLLTSVMIGVCFPSFPLSELLKYTHMDSAGE